MAWTVYTDGGSRGNPGPAGAGVVIADETGREVFAGGFFLGRKTNNQAEYEGLLKALELLQRAGAQTITIATDSELMACHLNGQYRVKAPGLRPLFEQAKRLLDGFGQWRIEHIPREQNFQADRLANQAMSAGRDIVQADRLSLVPRFAAGAAPRQMAPTKIPALGEPSRGPVVPGGIEVFVVRGPAKGVCPAGTRSEQSFVFTETVPGGVCVDACSAVIEAVRAMRDACRSADGGILPMSVRCGNEACGAVFEIRPAR